MGTLYLISAIFFFIGVALAALRFRAGRYAFAVLAGPFLGFGAFVALSGLALIPPQSSGPAFFVSLAIGCALIYPIGARRAAWWPLVPAALLLALALFVAGELAYPLGGP